MESYGGSGNVASKARCKDECAADGVTAAASSDWLHPYPLLISGFKKKNRSVGPKVGKSYFIINDAQPFVLHMLLRPHDTLLTGTDRLFFIIIILILAFSSANVKLQNCLNPCL